MKGLRLVILVSSDKSDLYFANQLMQRLKVVGVIIEHQRDEIQPASKLKKIFKFLLKPHQLIRRVFEKGKEARERKYAAYNQPENRLTFGKEGENIIPMDGVSVFVSKGKNSINSSDVIHHLKKLKPDVIAVCGTSLIKDEILSLPKNGALNLHGGLSQFYRGLWTTDWAIYNEEPEYVGATVHFISPGIDDGDIAYQGRPLIEQNDNPHTLYVKVVKLGINMMERAILDIQKDTLSPVQLNHKGKLYLDSMTTPKIRSLTWGKLSKGIMNHYLDNKEERDRKVLTQLVNPYQTDK